MPPPGVLNFDMAATGWRNDAPTRKDCKLSATKPDKLKVTNARIVVIVVEIQVVTAIYQDHSLKLKLI